MLPCVLILEKCKSQRVTFPFGLLREIKYDRKYQCVEDAFTHLRSNVSEEFYQKKMNLPSKCERKVSFGLRIIQSRQPEPNGDSWHFLSPAEKKVIDAIGANRPVSLGQVATITSGLKTTADSVFVHPMTKSFIEDRKLEKNLIHPYIQASNIERWKIRWTGTQKKSDTYVFYPHLTKGKKVVPINLDEYPHGCCLPEVSL